MRLDEVRWSEMGLDGVGWIWLLGYMWEISFVVSSGLGVNKRVGVGVGDTVF